MIGLSSASDISLEKLVAGFINRVAMSVASEVSHLARGN
jgi:hypothetical protein